MERLRHLPLAAFAVILSLLLAPPAVSAQAQADGARKDAACAAMTCVSGCCATMVCCQGAPKGPPQPEQAPAPARDGLEAGEVALPSLPLLYRLPRAERRLAMGEEAQQAHALPRRAALCIQTI